MIGSSREARLLYIGAVAKSTIDVAGVASRLRNNRTAMPRAGTAVPVKATLAGSKTRLNISHLYWPFWVVPLVPFMPLVPLVPLRVPLLIPLLDRLVVALLGDAPVPVPMPPPVPVTPGEP